MRKLILCSIISILLMACSSVERIVEVPIETIKTEYITNTKVDSVVIKDSIDRWIKGDTVFIYKEKVRYRYINKTDTIIQIDSIPKIINTEVTKEVKVNYITWYQKVMMALGGLFVLFGCYRLGKLIK